MNLTLKVWLEKNFPEILAMWVEFDKNRKKEYKRQFAKDHYKKASE